MPRPTRFRLPTLTGVLVTAALFAFPLGSGCGGGGATSTTGGSSQALPKGAIAIRVAWPQNPGRVIPANAQSIRIQVERGGETFDTRTLNRPANQTSFSDLPVGDVTVTAEAFEGTGGTGALLASATMDVHVVENTTANVALTLVSELASLTSVPSTISLSIGGNSTPRIGALNSLGEIVLLSPSTLTFTSSDPSVATVSAAGEVSGVQEGTGVVTVTESDSGLDLDIPVAVYGSPTLLPQNVNGTVGETITFSA
ncbi:MAG: hypothetical protein C4320_04250, partial [Armatimonadota bacterium]